MYTMHKLIRPSDGDRLFYDGSALVIANGTVRAQGAQFGLADVEVVTATIDLKEIWSYRTNPSRGLQAVSAPRYERFTADLCMSASKSDYDPDVRPTPVQLLRYHQPEEV
jgi:NAD+ synthase (glutamine-hydrolysing)